MVVWKSPRLKKSYMGKLERQIEKRELWNTSWKLCDARILFIYSKAIIQRVKREFLLQNLSYHLKKNTKSEYSGQNIFSLGMVWYLKRDKIEVYLYQIEYRLCMKNTISIWALRKKKCRHKTNRTKNTKCQKIKIKIKIKHVCFIS